MRRLATALVAALLITACAGEADTGVSSALSSSATTAATRAEPTTSSPQVGTTATTTPASTTSTINPAAAKYLENFEFVWATIDERFYDPDFGGIDWDDVHDRYLPQVGALDSDDVFLELLNRMLFELNVSHLFIVPPGTAFVDPVLTTEGELGIHVRLLDGEWVITDVEPASPAADAGLRPGFLVERVGGQAVSEIAAAAPALPPLHERGIRSSQILAVEEALYGEPGTTTRIGYRDAADQPQEVTLAFRHRGSSTELIPGFPPVFTTLEVDRLEGGIGYIAFDPFAPGLAAPLKDAIGAMRDAPGLIIDVRGNHGGNSDVGKQLIDELVIDRVLIWTLQRRHGAGNIHAQPSPAPYDGPVVVLVDVISSSAAEAFSAGIQAIGRADIVGERTAGRLLGGELAELPMGATMIYPITAPVTADGTLIEGRGVIPDVAVPVHRSDLLAGTDPPCRPLSTTCDRQPGDGSGGTRARESPLGQRPVLITH